MRVKTILLIFSVFVFALSCKDEELAITFTEHNFSLDNNNIVEINIPKAIGIPNISTKINTTIENKVSAYLYASSSNDDSLKTIMHSIDLFNKEFENFKADFPDSKQVWEAQFDGDLLYQSNEIISLSLTSYINTGGAHGILNINFLNFNPQTGDLITNAQLINDLEGFKEVAKPFFTESIKNKDLVITDVNTLPLAKNIAYSEDGIIILYNTYEIAPYTAGIIEYTIPFGTAAPFLVLNSF